MASSSAILPCGDSAATVLVCEGDHDVPRCECIVAHVDWNNFFLKVSNPGESSYTAAALESALKAFKEQFVVGNKDLICCLQKKFASLGVRVQPCFVFNLLQPGGEIYEALDVKTFRALRQAALGSCHSYIDRGCLEAFTLVVGQRIGFPVTLIVPSKKGCEPQHLELDLVFVQSSLKRSSLIFQEDCRLLSICSAGAGVGMTGSGVVDPVAQDLVSLWAYGATDCHLTLYTASSLDFFLDNYVHLLGCSGTGGCAIRVCLQIDLTKSHITTPGVSLSDVLLAATGGSTTVTPGQCICFPRSLTDNPSIQFVNPSGALYLNLTGCIVLKVSVEGCLDDCGITAIPTFTEYNLTLQIGTLSFDEITSLPNTKRAYLKYTIADDYDHTADFAFKVKDLIQQATGDTNVLPLAYMTAILSSGGSGDAGREINNTIQTSWGGTSGVAFIATVLPAHANDSIEFDTGDSGTAGDADGQNNTINFKATIMYIYSGAWSQFGGYRLVAESVFPAFGFVSPTVYIEQQNDSAVMRSASIIASQAQVGGTQGAAPDQDGNAAGGTAASGSRITYDPLNISTPFAIVPDAPHDPYDVTIDTSSGGRGGDIVANVFQDGVKGGSGSIQILIYYQTM